MERGVSVHHTTIYRWTVHYAPLLLKQFNRQKRPAAGGWHADETYIKGRGRWMCVDAPRDARKIGTDDLWVCDRVYLYGNFDSEAAGKASMFGALTLYPEFIKMFQFLLALVGNRNE